MLEIEIGKKYWVKRNPEDTFGHCNCQEVIGINSDTKIVTSLLRDGTVFHDPVDSYLCEWQEGHEPKRPAIVIKAPWWKRWFGGAA